MAHTSFKTTTDRYDPTAARRCDTADIPAHRVSQSEAAFFDYYQILLGDDADDGQSEDTGASGSGELKGYMDGLHSPWGIIGQIKEKRGYTHKQILWDTSWLNILMESADAPKHVKGRRVPVCETADEVRKILGR